MSGYEGPKVWFSSIGSTATSGTVNFSPALEPGQFTWFSLEETLTGKSITVGNATTLSTTLSGGGQTGASITVIQGQAVTDTAVVGGAGASVATGSVAYNVYADAACTKLVSPAGVGAITGGTAAASSAITTLPPGTYYWQATYAGDINNQAVASPCGTEVLKVLAPTSTSTQQTGAGLTGASLTMPQGTPVTDKAAIAGSLAKTATGSVTYTLYSDAKCTKAVASSRGAVVGGIAASSTPIAPKAGKYYWVAGYSGDGVNAPSSSACGSEVLLIGFKAELGLKAIKGCVSKRRFTAHPRAGRGVKLISVQLLINGKSRGSSRIKNGATTINLVGLPKGTFVVTMIATDSKGRKYVDIRTFHTCVVGKHHKHK